MPCGQHFLCALPHDNDSKVSAGCTQLEGGPKWIGDRFPQTLHNPSLRLSNTWTTNLRKSMVNVSRIMWLIAHEGRQ